MGKYKKAYLKIFNALTDLINSIEKRNLKNKIGFKRKLKKQL